MITRQGSEIKRKGTPPLKGGVVLLSFALSPGIPIRCKKIKKVSFACPLLCPLVVLSCPLLTRNKKLAHFKSVLCLSFAHSQKAVI